MLTFSTPDWVVVSDAELRWLPTSTVVSHFGRRRQASQLAGHTGELAADAVTLESLLLHVLQTNELLTTVDLARLAPVTDGGADAQVARPLPPRLSLQAIDVTASWILP
jgi:hypothetical protein